MTALLDTFGSAVAGDLFTLAWLHDRELDSTTITALQANDFPCSLAFNLVSPVGKEVFASMAGAVGALTGTAEEGDELAADFAAIYLTHGVGVSPCESVWLDEDNLVMQQPMFSVRESYAEAGLAVPDWRKRPDDHLVFQLQFVARLLEAGNDSGFRQAGRFLDDHTLRWLSLFAERVAARAATAFYACLAMLTAIYLDELRDVLARVVGEARPTKEEIEQRTRRVEAVALPMPRAYVPGGSPSW
jgi:TorA maturation chaperone TorD